MSQRIAARLLPVFALLLMPAGRADAGPIDIDTFATLNTWTTFNTPTAAGALQTDQTGTGILGKRDVILSAPGLSNGGDFIGIGTANFGIHSGNGVLDVASNGSTNFQLTLHYDGFGTLDLSDYLGIELNVLAYVNGTLAMTRNQIVLSTAMGGDLTSPLLVFPDVAFLSQKFLVPFLAFTGGGDLNQVTGITVKFNTNGTASPDYTLDWIRITEVPEPSALLLFGAVAASGAVWMRRRRQKQAA